MWRWNGPLGIWLSQNPHSSWAIKLGTLRKPVVFFSVGDFCFGVAFNRRNGSKKFNRYAEYGLQLSHKLQQHRQNFYQLLSNYH